MPNKTNLYMGWSAVTVTPSGGSAITIDHVTDIKIDKSSVLEAFFGDTNKFAALVKPTKRNRTCEIESGNAKATLSIPDGTACTIVAKLNHAEAGEGTGCLTLTLVNAVPGLNNAAGQTQRFANGNAGFTAFANTGDTDPLTIAVAS